MTINQIDDKSFFKDPSDVLDYVVDYVHWLAADSDTISTSTWSVETGITIDSETETATAATVWLSGGTAETRYLVTNTIVTAGGRTKIVSLNIIVEDN